MSVGAMGTVWGTFNGFWQQSGGVWGGPLPADGTTGLNIPKLAVGWPPVLGTMCCADDDLESVVFYFAGERGTRALGYVSSETGVELAGENRISLLVFGEQDAPTSLRCRWSKGWFVWGETKCLSIFILFLWAAASKREVH